MLLSEIVLKPRVRNDDLNRWEYDVDWDKSALIPLGVKQAQVRPTYDELPIFKQLGYDYHNYPKFPVVYAWTYNKHAPTGIPEKDDEDPNNNIRGSMDALKGRNPRHFMKPETLYDIYVKGFERIINNTYGKSSNDWNTRLEKRDKLYDRPIPLTDKEQEQRGSEQAYRLIQALLKGGDYSNVVIIPLASSSSVPKNVAKAMSEVMKGAPITDIMTKKLPTHSAKYFDKNTKNFENRNRVVVPAKQIAYWNRRVTTLSDRLDKLNSNDRLYNKDPEKWEQTYNDIENKIEYFKERLRRGWQIHNAIGDMGQPDGIDGFYGFQDIDQKYKSQLDGKIIVFIDDNIDSSATMADAYKGLMRYGIKPKKVLGFCPQKYK